MESDTCIRNTLITSLLALKLVRFRQLPSFHEKEMRNHPLYGHRKELDDLGIRDHRYN